MYIPHEIDPHLWYLINADCDGTISEQESRQLADLLGSEPNALELYVDFLTVNADVLWLMSAKQRGMDVLRSSVSTEPAEEPAPRTTFLSFLGGFTDYLNQRMPLSLVMLLVVFGAMLCTATYLIIGRNSNATPDQPNYVAQITLTKDCNWSSPTEAPFGSAKLAVGRKLELEKGIVQITYLNKAQVVLEGPVSFTVDSAKSGFLSQGKLYATANSKQSRFFTINTHNAKFVDFGTEFGVLIDSKGNSAMAVFDGKVDAAAKMSNGSWTKPISVKKGEAVACIGESIASHVVDRSFFPSLQPLVPPTPDTNFQCWLRASKELQNRKDLVAYYDCLPNPNNPNVLFNRAQSGALLNGEIQNASWVQGRFPEKKALEFKAKDAGVLVNIPGKYERLTFIMWLNIKQLENEINGLVLSNDWSQPGQLHWEILSNKLITMNICSQNAFVFKSHQSAEPMADDCFNRWCMLASVLDMQNKTCSFYINDKCISSVSNDLDTPYIEIGPATIAGWLEHGDDPTLETVRNLNCRMDEMIILKNALAAEEIKQIYEFGKP